jgi:hypothetical protein
MLIDEINRRAANVEAIQRIKEAKNKGVQIQWETDFSKMNFEKLQSYNNLKTLFSREFLRIDQMDTTDNDVVDIFRDTERYIDLFNIVLNGEKMIPPATMDVYAVVDGHEKLIIPAYSNGVYDGCHRTTLAAYFGQRTIPRVVFKTCDEYWFTPSKWIFEECSDGVMATSRETNQVITLKNYGSIVDTSNENYIVIIQQPK